MLLAIVFVMIRTSDVPYKSALSFETWSFNFSDFFLLKHFKYIFVCS